MGRKQINDQKDWDNGQLRMVKAGERVTLKFDLDWSNKHAADDLKKTFARSQEIAIAENDEWIRCFDDDSMTRDARGDYCDLKAANAKMNKADKRTDFGTTVAATQRKQINDQKDWDNSQLRMVKAGERVTLKFDLDWSNKHAADDLKKTEDTWVGRSIRRTSSP